MVTPQFIELTVRSKINGFVRYVPYFPGQGCGAVTPQDMESVTL